MKLSALIVLAIVSAHLDLVEQSFLQGIPQRFNLTLTNAELRPAPVILKLTESISPYLSLDQEQLVIPLDPALG